MINRYVNTDVIGGDGSGSSLANAYATLALWEAGEQGVMIDDHTVHCYATAGTPDSQTILSGWTQNGHRIYIVDDNENLGYYDITRYRIDQAVGHGFRSYMALLTITNIQFKSGDSYNIGFYITSGVSDITIERCICAGGQTGILGSNCAGASTSNIRIRNNIFYDNTIAGVSMNDADVDFYIFNNTFHNNTIDIVLSNAHAHYCRCNRMASNDAWGGALTDNDAINDYNYIIQNENNVANGSHGAFNQVFIYENEAGDRFRPGSGDPCIENGEDLSGHLVCPVTIDIQGNPRTGLWIGAHDEISEEEPPEEPPEEPVEEPDASFKYLNRRKNRMAYTPKSSGNIVFSANVDNTIGGGIERNSSINPWKSLLIYNTGENDIHLTINNILVIVSPDEVFDDDFEDFNEIEIGPSETLISYRLYCRS